MPLANVSPVPFVEERVNGVPIEASESVSAVNATFTQVPRREARHVDAVAAAASAKIRIAATGQALLDLPVLTVEGGDLAGRRDARQQFRRASSGRRPGSFGKRRNRNAWWSFRKPGVTSPWTSSRGTCEVVPFDFAIRRLHSSTVSTGRRTSAAQRCATARRTLSIGVSRCLYKAPPGDAWRPRLASSTSSMLARSRPWHRGEDRRPSFRRRDIRVSAARSLEGAGAEDSGHLGRTVSRTGAERAPAPESGLRRPPGRTRPQDQREPSGGSADDRPDGSRRSVASLRRKPGEDRPND